MTGKVITSKEKRHFKFNIIIIQIDAGYEMQAATYSDRSETTRKVLYPFLQSHIAL